MNKDLSEDGFVVIKNFFTNSDISKMKDMALSYFKTGKGFKNSGGIAKPDWIKDPDLNELLELCSLDRISNEVSKLVGEKVLFIEHNDLHFNRSVEWHKDRLNGKARSFEKHDPWSSVGKETMKIFKVNIYLQDHIDDNDGLVVKKGSHKTDKINVGQDVFIKTKSGDLVLFDQRITHKATKIKNRNRLLICFGFGVKNIFFEEFKNGTIFRQKKQNKK